jgi:hypothetical protein
MLTTLEGMFLGKKGTKSFFEAPLTFSMYFEKSEELTCKLARIDFSQ